MSTKIEKVLTPINIMENKCQGIAENSVNLLSELIFKSAYYLEMLSFWRGSDWLVCNKGHRNYRT